MKLQKSVPLIAKHSAFDYQAEAAEIISSLEYGAVFHEQGLGKTKIALDVALSWLTNGVVDSVIFVTKRALVQNWKDEITEHTHLKPKIFSQDKRANYFAFNSPSQCYIAHYEAIKSESKRVRMLAKIRKLGVILDEAHKIKNPESSITKCFIGLAPSFYRKVIMTGTPIANRPYDIWSQIFFLDNGNALGTDFSSFKTEMDLSSDLNEEDELRDRFESSLSDLFPKLSEFSVRETKDGGRIELPKKEISLIACDWETSQWDKYCEIRNELKTIVVRNGIPTEDNSEDILKRLLRLVQVASNPRMIDEQYTVEPGKFEIFEDLARTIIGNDEKLICWSAFATNVDILYERFRELGAVKVHGGLNMSTRNLAVKSFKENSGIKVLFATPGAAKEGLTLTVANHVIFFDRTFSLDDYLQAQDRIHRISQTKTCYVYNLSMRDSIDEWVDLLLRTKELAAKLGQGDISVEQYKQAIEYSFPDLLKEILGIKD